MRSDTSPNSAQRGSARRVLAAGSVGHLVEAYDFAVYGFMIVPISLAFFDDASETAGALEALAVFGVAFVVRPLGSLLFGRYGDRAGRRAAITASILMLGAATLLIGILPTYAQVGVLAPVLLVMLRLLQGLPFAGETGVGPVFIAEHAPPGRRGLWASSVQVTGQLGFILASVLAILLTSSLSETAMSSWGWRLAFVAAAPLALVGLYLRLRTEDSEVFATARRSRGNDEPAPVAQVFRRNWRQLLQLTALQSLGSPYYLIIVYLPVYLRGRTEVRASEAAWVGLIAIAAMAALIPVAAMLGDHFGRRPLFLTSGVLTLMLVTPAFLLAGSGGFSAAVAGALLLSLPLVGYYGGVSAAQNELFSTDVRATGAGIGYNIGVVLFSGFPPFLAAALVAGTGSGLAPAFMVMVLVSAGLWAAARYPRRHRLNLDEIR